MARQVARRSGHRPPHFADGQRHQRRVGQVRDAQRHVDAFVDEIRWPVEHVQSHRHVGELVHELVEQRAQKLLARGDRPGDGELAPRAGEAAFVERCHKHLHRIDSIHESSSRRNTGCRTIGIQPRTGNA
jgi:hypothetical protein